MSQIRREHPAPNGSGPMSADRNGWANQPAGNDCQPAAPGATPAADADRSQQMAYNAGRDRAAAARGGECGYKAGGEPK